MKKNVIPTFDDLLTHRDFHQLCKWVKSFMITHKLFSPSKKAVISLSGGADSLLLTLVLKQLQELGQLDELKIVHFHHGTRPSQDQELSFVKKCAENLEIDGDFIYLNLGVEIQSNFEMLAREERYLQLKKYEDAGHAIYLGHHIDDSFEWSLMQQFKSSEIKSTLGIPVKNGLKMRPFMCLCRHQIIHFLRLFEMPYLTDPTNALDQYERNFIRNSIVPLIKEKYPSYLKNYVSRQNKLVEELNKPKIERWSYEKDQLGAVLLKNTKEGDSFNREQVMECIRELSPVQRGKTRDQIDKLRDAYKNNKKGPLSFSGGVKIYIEKDRLYFTNSMIEEKFSKIDSLIYQQLKSTQIPCEGLPQVKKNFRLKNRNKWLYPEIIFCRDKLAFKALGPSLKNTFHLLPKSTGYLVDNKIWFQALGKISKIDPKFNIEGLSLSTID